MSNLFLRLLNISITAGWIVLIVVLLRFVLKKAPKWIRVALWGLVALRLLLPVSIESVLSLVPSAETVAVEPVTYEIVQVRDSNPVPVPVNAEEGERIVLQSGFSALNSAVNPVMVQTKASTVTVLKSVAGWVWLSGAAAMLLYALISYLRLKHKVRASVRIEKGVYVCDDISDPFILGLIRPRICLPSGMDETTKGYVLAHERAHLKRFDHIWKPLGFLLLAVYWFNPLLWLAYILLCRDIELACDEKVVKELDDTGKAAYSEALVTASVSRRSIAACPLAFAAVGIKSRIHFVLRYRKPSQALTGVGVLSCFALAICFLTVPAKQIIPPFPDITAEDQLYGTWTISQITYKTHEDDDPVILKGSQLNSSLHLTFYPDGVVHLLSEPNHHETVGRYELNSENVVSIWGKEHAGKNKVLHLLTAVYDPCSDTLNIPLRSLIIESFSRSANTDSVSRNGVSAEFHVQSLNAYH